MLSERRGELNAGGGGVFSSDIQGVSTWLRINSSYINENSDTDSNNNRGASSYHPGGATFAMADGAVVFLGNSTEYIVYNRLGGRADGRVASLP
jgi:prepilin-type processing-associated H-X9-DG protein